MAKFYELEVTDLHKTVRDAVVVTLRPDPAALEKFAFRHGQYLTFRHHVADQEIRRSYSICTGLDDGKLQVGIKRVDGGIFSTFANDELRIGDRLSAMPPMGQFTFELSPKQSRRYLAFAAGSGITPILSIIKTVLSREPQAHITLVYANRSVNTIMLRDELEDLKNRHMGQLTTLHILKQDAQDIELFTGRVTEQKCADLFKHWIDPQSIDLAFICGPEAMMLGVANALKKHGVNEEQIKFELFATSQSQLARKKAARPDEQAQPEMINVRIKLDGATRSFQAPKTMAILDVALSNALDAPFACRAGVCSTCRCKIIEGEVEMAANHALEDYEVRRGFALSCQSYPVSNEILVDYDQ